MRTLLLVLLVLTPSAGWAGEALLVYGPAGADDKDRDAASGAVADAFERTISADASVPVGDIAPPHDGALVPYGAARVDRCGGPSVAAAQIRGNTERGIAAADELDYDNAVIILEQSRLDLVCANALLDKEEVEVASWTLGLVAHYRGDRAGAEAWFGEALGIHPEHEWDDTYPPDAQQTFNHALSEVLRRPDSVVVVPADGNIREVRIDGELVDPLAGRVTVKAGWHVAQWRTASGAVAGAAFEAADGDPVALLTRDALHAAILAGPGAPDQLGATTDRLAALAAARGVDEIYVAGGAEGVVYRYDATSRSVQAAPGSDAVSSTASWQPPGPSLALVIAGAWTAGAGAVIGLAGYGQGAEVRTAWEQSYDDELASEYEGFMTQNQVGYVVAGVGGALVVAGIIAAVAENKQNVTVGAMPVEGGAHVGVTLAF